MPLETIPFLMLPRRWGYEEMGTMYHAVRNPKMELARKSLVYFAIPDLRRSYSTLLGKNQIDVAAFADESHRAF